MLTCGCSHSYHGGLLTAFSLFASQRCLGGSCEELALETLAKKLCLAVVGVDNGCGPYHSSPSLGALSWPPNPFGSGRWSTPPPVDGRCRRRSMSLPSCRHHFARHPRASSGGLGLLVGDVCVLLVSGFSLLRLCWWRFWSMLL